MPGVQADRRIAAVRESVSRRRRRATRLRHRSSDPRARDGCEHRRSIGVRSQDRPEVSEVVRRSRDRHVARRPSGDLRTQRFVLRVAADQPTRGGPLGRRAARARHRADGDSRRLRGEIRRRDAGRGRCNRRRSDERRANAGRRVRRPRRLDDDRNGAKAVRTRALTTRQRRARASIGVNSETRVDGRSRLQLIYKPCFRVSPQFGAGYAFGVRWRF